MPDGSDPSRYAERVADASRDTGAVDVNDSAESSCRTSTFDVVRTFEKQLAAPHHPSEVVVKQGRGGRQELVKQMLARLGGALVFSVVLVYLLMVALYDDFRGGLTSSMI